VVAPTATFDWKELTPVAAHPAPSEFPVGRVDAGRADRDPDLADSSLETQRAPGHHLGLSVLISILVPVYYWRLGASASRRLD